MPSTAAARSGRRSRRSVRGASPPAISTTRRREAMAERSAVLGGRRIALADDQPTFWERVAADAWEPGTRRLIDALVDASTLFVDLGAWVGPTTLQAAA